MRPLSHFMTALDLRRGEGIYVNVNNIHTEGRVPDAASDYDLGRLWEASLDHGDDRRLSFVVAHRAFSFGLSDLEWTHGMRK
jgi:hypothetical protein